MSPLKFFRIESPSVDVELICGWRPSEETGGFDEAACWSRLDIVTFCGSGVDVGAGSCAVACDCTWSI